MHTISILSMNLLTWVKRTPWRRLCPFKWRCVSCIRRWKNLRIESSFTRIVINVLLFASWIFLITIYYNMYYAYIIFFNNMADNLVNLYWLGKCSAVRETTPVVTQRSREASDMPRTKKRKTLLEGGIISSRYIVAAILNMILNMLALKKIAVLLRIFVYCLWFIFLMFYACSLLS